MLAALRDKRTTSTEFRRLAHRVSLLVTAEATRDLATHEDSVETPLERTHGTVIDVSSINVVTILRAGLGMLGGMVRAFEVVPDMGALQARGIRLSELREA